MKGFYRQKKCGTRKFLTKEKNCFRSGHLLLGSEGRSYRGVIMQITLLMLIRKFQMICLKVTFLGEIRN